MNIIEFVDYLRKLNIKLFLEGDLLRCKAPEGTLTPTLKSEISDRKAEIISFLQQANLQIDTTAIAPISRTENKTFPLSFTQEGVWFLYELQPNSPFYNIPLNLHFSGQLNIAALESSLQLLIDRHEILRTNFITVYGKPAQVINATRDFTLPVVDLRSLSASQRDLEYQKLASLAISHVFNLAEEALLWSKLVQLTPTKNVLLLTIHHIIFDGWSANIFLQELTKIYSALVEHRKPNLPKINLQYVDFAVWQKQWLQGEVLESQLAYWQQKLALMPALLELPTDRPRPAVQSFRGETQVFTIEPSISEALVRLSQQQEVTLFMLLLTAFKILLYRYTNQPDIVVGSPVANRQHPQTQGMLGFFVNTLVLRTDLSDNPTFLELLQEVKKVVLEAYDRQELPFDKLVEALHPERNLSYSPLFQINFLLKNEATSAINIKDLTINISNSETNHTAKFDLSLSLQKTDRVLTGGFEYSTDLFDATTIAKMIEHWQTLLAGIVANPEQKLSDLPILTAIETHKLLVEWNQTQQDYPNNLCIHQLFEAQVEQTPDAAAVIFKDEQLTYRELNTKANQIAHYLQALGVKPETLVGICVERSLDMIIGLLGILKAGGAYVPIDPAYPVERIAYMLDDSQLPVLLTQKKLLASLPEHQAQVICLDCDWEKISTESELSPITDVTPENLAYVIYTSGSTGKPKGVLVGHQGLCNLAQAQIKLFDVQNNSCILQFASISFDASIWEIVMALCAGAKLCLGTREELQPGQTLLRLLQEQKITHLTLVPSALAALPTQDLPDLQSIVVAGEPCPSSLVTQWASGRRFFNAYGPTEATVCATVAQCFKGMDVLPIGRPIDNTQVYILDRYLQPVPIGVPGELHIASVGLARGYLNRPDLTEKKFIPNPFSNQPGERLYKTGDLARYLPDGNIEYIGRIDNQVKIRGFRIELGEIEAILSQHPSIREAAVIASENIALDKQLVAYVVPHQQSVPSISDLRRFLREKLPDYMVPSAFVVLESLPLTPNGKVDRRVLPAPEKRLELEESFVAPRTPIEEILANIWGNILSINSAVGIHDNFFELGGHSLLATQVISRVRDTFGIELPLRSLFEAPTIVEFASRVENSIENVQSQEALPLVPISRSEPIPLSFAQARLWFLDQLQPESAFYNIPLALHLNGQLNIAALQRAINEIIQRHEALRTNFTTIEGQPFQVIASTLNCELQVVNLLHLPESDLQIEAQQLALAEANRPFNLEREPLLRGTVLQLGETEYVLLLTMHHIISDGWSLGVFVKELTELYTTFCSGKFPSLPKLPIQYADFAVWQRQWLQGEILETQLNYWKQQLLDAPALLELPTDRPRPAVKTFRGAHQSLAISQELSLALVAYSKRTGVTLFMLLVAAFQTLLYRYTGQDDILVGTPVANRNRQEIEGLIGFFVNTLVLRTDLSGNPTFEQLLNRVREVALQAYAHQDLPFEQLVEALHPARDLSYTPLFQVMFALDDANIPSMELPELTVSSYPVEIGTAKFDLTLSMENTAFGLVGGWEYNADLFEEATIARMARHFQTLLEAIAANPQQKISQLPLLTETEQHQLLVEWNNTETEYPQDKCIHQLFEEQVELTPDAVAVVFEAQQLTYRELNARANQLAHYLQRLGVDPEMLVGICVERSLEMVIGLLGILKAGGAYVPLDPAYPQERLAFIMEDSSVSVLLTQAQLAEKLPQPSCRIVYLDFDSKEIAFQSEENLHSSVAPNNLAYVIYTSGSTGRPKGVAIEHHSTVAFLSWAEEIFASEDITAILASTSICFDLSVFELFVPLCRGGKVILAENALSLPSLAGSSEITLINTVPSAIAELVRLRGIPAGVRTINLAGEALPNKLVQQLYEQTNVRQVFNLYGPSEDTTYSTVALVEKGERIVTIGRPISNTQIYLLDSYLQPVPIGVSGELYISGDGLARGYLNRPDLTAEKFIPNPFSNEPGSRLYKTGDLARYLPDGNIEYLGRIDNQVKVRGFRIELGEIEAVLSQHPGVREAAVIATENVAGNKQLVAYVVPHQQSAPSISDLRRYLKKQLPDYMVPSAFVVLDALPLTPNGKVDRRALKAPDNFHNELEEKFVAPRTPTEMKLAAIWAEVLGVRQVGINDNFFELGGHSLIATQIISRIRQAFAIELHLRHLFEAPTIASLCKIIETTCTTSLQEPSSNSIASDSLPPLVPATREGHIPLSIPQEYIWHLQQLNPHSYGYNSGVALKLTLKLSSKVLEKSINEIIRRHESLRTTFTVVNGQPVQAIFPELTVPLKIVDLQNIPSAKRETEALHFSQREMKYHFDLANGPLIKATLVRLSPEEHWLLIPMHHIITDGWSAGIFVQELQTLYNAFSNGLPSPLPELPLQYADFTLWQRQRFNEVALARLFDYWLQKLLAPLQPLDILPAQEPKSNPNSRRASSYSLVLRKDLVASLKDLSRSQSITISAIIIAALKLTLLKWSEQSEILVAVTIGNRIAPEIEKIIGCFINDVILRTQLDDTQTGVAFLEQVQETLSEAISHREIASQKVIKAVKTKRELALSACVVIEPIILDNERMPGWELAPIQGVDDELWDEAIPLELYTRSPSEHSQTIELGMIYSTDLFNRETIECLFSYYQEILQKLADSPKMKMAEIGQFKLKNREGVE